MSKKLQSSGVLKSDCELKIQKQHSHSRFMLTILIHINNLTLNGLIPDKVKKFNSIFTSIQLSEMIGSLRVKFTP